jgi:hypothetical protein
MKKNVTVDCEHATKYRGKEKTRIAMRSNGPQKQVFNCDKNSIVERVTKNLRC